MKKKLLSIAVVFLVGILMFTGCGFQALIGGPSKSDPVTSNGNRIVIKGSYLYFTNGYKKASDLTNNDNAFGVADYSALYRTKLDENGELIYDEDGILQAEILAPKVVGIDNGGFYIFGDKIYYATPNAEKDTQGNLDFKKTAFFYSNLDGTNVNRIYTTTVSSDKFSFAFYEIDEVVYLVVYDTANLVIVNTNTNDQKIIEKVSSVAMPVIDSISVSEAENNVYYTRSANDDDGEVSQGNIMAYIGIKSMEEVVISKNATYVVKTIKQDKLFYTKKLTNDKNAYFYMADYKSAEGENKANIDVANEKQISYQAFDNAVFVLNFEGGNYRGMLTQNASGYLTYIKPVAGGLPEFEVLTEEVKLTPLAVYGDDIFAYNSDNELYKINYKTKVLVKLTYKETDTLSFTMTNNIDFDGKYVYVFKEYKKDDKNVGYYLVRIDTTLSEDFECKLVGKVIKDHIKVEKEK